MLILQRKKRLAGDTGVPINPPPPPNPPPPAPAIALGLRILVEGYAGFCLQLRQQFSIVAVNTTAETFSIAGDKTALFTGGLHFFVTGSSGNNGEWIVSNADYDATNTIITVSGNLTNATANGIISVYDDFGFVGADVGDSVDTAAIAAWLAGANGYVSIWYDQSGNTRHFIQATTSFQPLYVANIQNGHPALAFDAVDDRLTRAELFDTTDIALAAVIDPLSAQGAWLTLVHATFFPFNISLYNGELAEVVGAGLVVVDSGFSQVWGAFPNFAEDVHVVSANAEQNGAMEIFIDGQSRGTGVSNGDWSNNGDPTLAVIGLRQCRVMEVLVWDGDISTGQHAYYADDANTYWSIY